MDQEALKKAEKVYKRNRQNAIGGGNKLSKIAKTQAVMTLRSEMPLSPKHESSTPQEIKSLKAFGVSDPEIARLQKSPKPTRAVQSDHAFFRGRGQSRGKRRPRQGERMTDQGLFPGRRRRKGRSYRREKGPKDPDQNWQNGETKFRAQSIRN